MKTRNSCKEEKLLSEFHKKSSSADGFRNVCKKCRVEESATYYSGNKEEMDRKSKAYYACHKEEASMQRQARHRSRDGLLRDIYNVQKASSKARGHAMPAYSFDELKEYALQSDVFNRLYNQWVSNDYDKQLVPSFDRIDDYKGYSFANIRIVTWEVNDKKGRSDRKDGINNKASIPVIRTNKDGSNPVRYPSFAIASRAVGIGSTSISKVCDPRYAKYKTAKGFKWQYASGERVQA